MLLKEGLKNYIIYMEDMKFHIALFFPEPWRYFLLKLCISNQ